MERSGIGNFHGSKGVIRRYIANRFTLNHPGVKPEKKRGAKLKLYKENENGNDVVKPYLLEKLFEWRFYSFDKRAYFVYDELEIRVSGHTLIDYFRNTRHCLFSSNLARIFFVL